MEVILSYSNRPNPQQAYDYARSQQNQGNLQATFETLFDLQQVYPNFADVPAWLQFFQQQNYRYTGNASLFRQVGVGSPVAVTSGSPTQFQIFVPPPPPPSPMRVSPKSSSPNRAPLFTILGIIAALIVVVGIVAVWLIQDSTAHSQATATAQAQAIITIQSATAVAQSRATATAISQATITYQSQQTATAQSLALATVQSQQTATAVTQATITAQSLALATAQSQQTATAISQATATVRATQAAATQTAIYTNQLNATATARGQFSNATATALANFAATATARTPGGIPPLGQPGVKVFGPDNGDLKQADADHLATKSSNQNLHNFVAKARFSNPDNFSVPWDIGFVFRRSDTNQYRLVVVSDGHWEVTDGDGNSVTSGSLSGFNKTTTGSNSLALFVKDSTGVFYFNDQKISTFDVAANQDKGDIKVGADFFTEDSFVGRTTKYQDFTVWSSD